MMPRLDSLRGQLVASMLFVFMIGIGGARILDQHMAALGRLDLNLLREPYQDILVLIAFSLGAGALIWLVSGWNLRQLGAASREAAAVGPSNLNARISTERLPDEVRPLVDAVNGALDRLTQAYEAEQRFVARAAHELRTPLAVLSLRLQRAKLDGALDWAAIDGDVAQLSRLVGQLLDLAHKEHSKQRAAAGMSIVNLSRIAREAAATVVTIVEQSGRDLNVALPAAMTVRGRPDDLRDMIRNLLDNALLHGQGTIRLAGQIERGENGDQCWLTVTDQGMGVPSELHEAMFERFRKGQGQSSGHGLGLAIVREVAHGHGGSVAFLPGPGCQIRLVLPLLRTEPQPAPADSLRR
ncbi:MAG TPA: HAMP domain-containing sensor histidine kinase [Stellaceae bacterium]|nr:HAMP domain-containing sensor histidine kinase [Stellaceae bacterium]